MVSSIMWHYFGPFGLFSFLLLAFVRPPFEIHLLKLAAIEPMIYIFIEDRADFIASSKTGIALSPRKLNSFSSGNGIEVFMVWPQLS